MKFRPLFAIVLCVSTVACNSAPLRDRQPSSVSGTGKYCVRENISSLDGKTIVCEKMFPARPYVHVPGTQTQTTNALVYGHLVKENTLKVSIVDNAGMTYRLYDKTENPLDVAKLIGQQGLKTSYTVYRVFGVFKEISSDNPDGSTSKKKSILVYSLRPEIIISGCAIDSALAGIWTGKVSSRLKTSGFNQFHATLPVHISIQSLSRGKSFEDITQPQTSQNPIALKDGEIFEMNGEIDNFDHDVHDLTGDFPSLATLGEANPFLGAENSKIKIYRMSSMHALGDSEFVIQFPSGTLNLSKQGMAPLTFTPSDFIAIHSPTQNRHHTGSIVLRITIQLHQMG